MKTNVLRRGFIFTLVITFMLSFILFLAIPILASETIVATNFIGYPISGGEDFLENATNTPRITRKKQKSPRGSLIIFLPIIRKGREIFSSFYFISCSKPSNIGEVKNSCIVISSPSHIFFTVETVGFFMVLLTILLKVDCVMPHMIDSLFIVISLSRHNSSILKRTASLMFTSLAPNFIWLIHFNLIKLK